MRFKEDMIDSVLSEQAQKNKLYGDDGKKDPPVSIPNTAVKLLSAECSWGLPPVRLGRCRAIFYGELAQLGERLPYKQNVGGSSPSFSIMIR